MNSVRRWRDPFSPWGEGARRADEGAFLLHEEVAPHQFGQMTYDRATKRVLVAREAHAAVSHGLTSSPPRGEGTLGHGKYPFDRSQAGGSALGGMLAC